MTFRAIAATAALLTLLTACKDVTHVQTGYISDRDDCYARAQYGVNSYTASTGNITGKDKSNITLQLFCECMKQYEWSVAGCKFKDKAIAGAPTAPQSPTVVVVQAPPAAAAAAQPAYMEPCPAPKQPGKKRAKRKLDGTCPAPEEFGQQELDKVLNQE